MIHLITEVARHCLGPSCNGRCDLHFWLPFSEWIHARFESPNMWLHSNSSPFWFQKRYIRQYAKYIHSHWRCEGEGWQSLEECFEPLICFRSWTSFRTIRCVCICVRRCSCMLGLTSPPDSCMWSVWGSVVLNHATWICVRKCTTHVTCWCDRVDLPQSMMK